ncbi:hypothetical protein [Pannonibacter phragmitetus]|uniref:hypothetical protein n=1 Tax=Pannonibacter phragmitetus TaxID=121719 RepID=UPI000B965B14|nr:hypothetical protein [Pannonibacter phragmitetus]
MLNVDKTTFERVIAQFDCACEYETDAEYGYDTYTLDGVMVGLISYHSHRGDTYALYGPAADAARKMMVA